MRASSAYPPPMKIRLKCIAILSAPKADFAAPLSGRRVMQAERVAESLAICHSKCRVYWTAKLQKWLSFWCYTNRAVGTWVLYPIETHSIFLPSILGPTCVVQATCRSPLIESFAPKTQDIRWFSVQSWRPFNKAQEATLIYIYLSLLYSLVITIERVSIDSRGGASLGARGLMNETCGQTATRRISYNI